MLSHVWLKEQSKDPADVSPMNPYDDKKKSGEDEQDEEDTE